MKTFLLNLRGEILKTKNTAASWLALISGLFVPILLCIACICRPTAFLNIFQDDHWLHYIQASWRQAIPFLFPIYIILICSLIVQIEYRNSTWKQVFTSPRSYFDIYFSKFTVILLLVLFSLLTFNIAITVAGYIIALTNNKFHFMDSPPPVGYMVRMTAKIFISILAITAIQYWLAIRFRNFIISFGIGFGLMIASFIVISWDKARYIPYLYPSQVFIDQVTGMTDNLHETLICSLTIFTVVMLFGFADLMYKKEKT